MSSNIVARFFGFFEHASSVVLGLFLFYFFALRDYDFRSNYGILFLLWCSYFVCHVLERFFYRLFGGGVR